MKKKVLHTKALLPDMSYPKIVFPNGAENLVRLRFTGSVNRPLILPDQNLKKKISEYRPKSDCLVTPNTHTAIVSQERFERCRLMKNARATKGTFRNMFSVFAFYNTCGADITIIKRFSERSASIAAPATKGQRRFPAGIVAAVCPAQPSKKKQHCRKRINRLIAGMITANQ